MSNNAAVDPNAPCQSESVMWRECLKIYDYGPEKPEKDCEKERGRYYTCIKSWRTETTGKKADAARDFTMHPDCAGYSQNLHNCMMINMFEMNKCTNEMTLLRMCGARFDKSIAAALEDDVKNRWVVLPKVEETPEDSTGLKRVWNKVIGKI